jgi:hypothetical protein
MTGTERLHRPDHPEVSILVDASIYQGRESVEWLKRNAGPGV